VDPGAAGAVQLPDRSGWWRPFPVEYKRGRPKADSCDEVQLCAQAMCLEETLGVVIGSGALFYGTTAAEGNPVRWPIENADGGAGTADARIVFRESDAAGGVCKEMREVLAV
jgi:hypothetical protein